MKRLFFSILLLTGMFSGSVYADGLNPNPGWKSKSLGQTASPTTIDVISSYLSNLVYDVNGTSQGEKLTTPALTGGTSTGLALTTPTVATPTITGGTSLNLVMTTPTITGGTSLNLVMTTPTINGGILTGGTSTNQTIITPAISTPAIAGGTTTNQTITTPTITNPTIGSGTSTNLTLTTPTLNTPSISGGTSTNQTLATPTITGGTSTNQTLTTPTIATPTITSPAVSGGTSSNEALTNPTITGGTTTNQTLNTPTIVSPTFTGGSTTNQVITSPTINGGTTTNQTITTPTINGGTTTNQTLNTPTISNPIFNGGGASSLNLTSPTISTPTITGGSATGLSLVNPTFSGGTFTNLTLTTPNIIGANAASALQFNADGSTTFSSTRSLGGVISIPTNSTYTLLPTDCGTTLEPNPPSAMTITVPSTLAPGCRVDINNVNTASISFVAGTGAFQRSINGNTSIGTQFQKASMFMEANCNYLVTIGPTPQTTSASSPVTIINPATANYSMFFAATGDNTIDITPGQALTLNLFGGVVGENQTLYLIIRQPVSGGFNVTLPTNVVWNNGRIPVVNTSKTTIMKFFTDDGGVTYFGGPY